MCGGKRKSSFFLNIDRAGTQFSDDVDTYADCVYEKARELLDSQIADRIYVTDAGDHYYLYELTMDGRSQTGIVACCSIDDYVERCDSKSHENTREEKNWTASAMWIPVNAQTGPIFLAYRQNIALKEIVAEEKTKPALYDFVSDDGIRHRVWRIDGADRTDAIEAAFAAIPSTYIADGHHRAASVKSRSEAPYKSIPVIRVKKPFNHFLCIIPG